MLQLVRNVLRDNKGVAALEYALIAGLIFVAVVGATTLLGTKMSAAFSSLGASITAHSTNGT